MLSAFTIYFTGLIHIYAEESRSFAFKTIFLIAQLYSPSLKIDYLYGAFKLRRELKTGTIDIFGQPKDIFINEHLTYNQL